MSVDETSPDHHQTLHHKVPDPVPGQRTSAPKIQLERRQILERKLQSNPNDPEAFLELAKIYREEHRPLEAKRVLEQGQKIFPDDMEMQWQWEEAVLARSLQQFREANDLASRVNSVDADHELERGQENWIKSRIDVCRARLRRDSTLLQLRVVLAEALFDAGEFDEAITAVQPVLGSDDFASPGYLIEGRCFLAIGKQVDAMRSLRASTMRRAVPAPLKIRIAGLRLLCDTAAYLGVTESRVHYELLLQNAQTELSSL